MRNLEPSWTRLTAAARVAAADEVVPAPDRAWLTRVGALGAEAVRCYRALPTWLAWSLPAAGIATAIALAAFVSLKPAVTVPHDSEQLVALVDPFAGGAFFPR